MLPPGQSPIVEGGKRCADSGIERLKIMESLTFNILIYGAVHQLHGILHKRLVARMADTGGKDCTVVELCERRKLLVDDRFIAVAARDG